MAIETGSRPSPGVTQVPSEYFMNDSVDRESHEVEAKKKFEIHPSTRKRITRSGGGGFGGWNPFRSKPGPGVTQVPPEYYIGKTQTSGAVPPQRRPRRTNLSQSIRDRTAQLTGGVSRGVRGATRYGVGVASGITRSAGEALREDYESGRMKERGERMGAFTAKALGKVGRASAESLAGFSKGLVEPRMTTTAEEPSLAAALGQSVGQLGRSAGRATLATIQETGKLLSQVELKDAGRGGKRPRYVKLPQNIKDIMIQYFEDKDNTDDEFYYSVVNEATRREDGGYSDGEVLAIWKSKYPQHFKSVLDRTGYRSGQQQYSGYGGYNPFGRYF